MNDRHQILHHFLFRRHPVLIEYQQLTAIPFCMMFEPPEPEPGGAVTVRKDKRLDSPLPDTIYEFEKLLALEI